jgi:hypothetical protein
MTSLAYTIKYLAFLNIFWSGFLTGQLDPMYHYSINAIPVFLSGFYGLTVVLAYEGGRVSE